MLSLTKIKSFIVVSEEGQFRRASERLGISQPALSAHIQDLEQALGVALFSRTTRNVRLTAEGQTFLNRAQRVLDDLNSATLELRERAQLKYGRVVIAATPTAAAHILPPLIVSFSRQFPGVHVQVLEKVSSEIVRLVITGAADFGVGPCGEVHDELAFDVISRERLSGILPLGHPLAGRQRVRLSELARYPLLTTAPGSAIYEAIVRKLRGYRTAASNSHVLTNHLTVIAMAAAGLGVGLLPERALTMIHGRKVNAIEVVDPEIALEIGVLQRKGGSSSSAAKEFLRLWLDGKLGPVERETARRLSARRRRFRRAEGK